MEAFVLLPVWPMVACFVNADFQAVSTYFVVQRGQGGVSHFHSFSARELGNTFPAGFFVQFCCLSGKGFHSVLI